MCTLYYVLFLSGTLVVPLPQASAQQRTRDRIAVRERDPEIVRDFEAGRALHRDGKLEQAIAAYKRVLERAPGLAAAHLNLGLVYSDQHDFAASTREYAKAASLDPSLHVAGLYLGIDMYLWGRYDLARKTLEELAKKRVDDSEALYWLGLARAASGDYIGGAESLETVARLAPKDDDALYYLQKVYLALWNATYERLVAADPNSFRIHQCLAEWYMQSNRHEDAKRECLFILRAYPPIAGVHEMLGDIARQQGDLAGSLKEYKSELELAPHSARTRYKLGDLLVETGEIAEGSKMLRSSIAIQPDFGPAYVALGTAARKEGRVAEAITHFQEALKLGLKGEREENAHFQLFRLLLAAGKTAEAETHHKQYLRLVEARQKRVLIDANRERKVEESTFDAR